MAIDVVMPQLGLTMTEGSVSSWLKKEGDWVEKGETLFTVETDKVEMEMEALASGYLLAILAQPGRIVPVGTAIARMGASMDEAAAPAAAGQAEPVQAEQPGSAAAQTTGSPRRDGRRPASPRARRLAQQLGIDIAALEPVQGDRITEADVRRAHEMCAAASSRPGPRPAGNARRIVAMKTAESFHSAPHFCVGVEVDASALVRFRAEAMERARMMSAVKPTYTDLFLKALALALSEHRALNANWIQGRVVESPSVDVCLAIQAGDGLYAPVIRNVDRLTLSGIAGAREKVVQAARAGALSVDELNGGAATLSNLGQHGIDWFQAILNPTQAVIAAVGRITERPRVVAGAVRPCPALTVTVSVDHRVVDGAPAAAFLSRFRDLLEDPATMDD